MAPNAKIIVKQNGQLIVDGGHLTNSDDCGDGFWQGIEVWGATGETQSVVSGVRPQGYLKIRNGGIIENALVGVTNWEVGNDDGIGGVIDVFDGEFINNKIAVDFQPHQNIHWYLGIPRPNLSTFKKTKFIVNDAYIGDLETEWPEEQVKLWGVDGVGFSGCEFLNTSTVSTSEKRSKGIFSEDAHYVVKGYCSSIQQVGQPCPAQNLTPTTFDGFYRGIEAAKVTDALPIKVLQTQFRNNMVGIELVNLDWSEIIFSDFEIGGHPHETGSIVEYANHLGIYSNETRCFAIEENEFSKDLNATWDEQNGVFVYKSEANSNNIYLNEFNELEHGAIGYQVNRNLNGFIGLQFTCNDMTDNFNDFVVSRTQGEGGFDDSGIRTFQGTLSPYISAGNEFSLPNGVSNEYTHWDINSGSQYFYYHMYGEEPDIENEVTPNTMFLSAADFSNGCTSNYSVGHQVEGGISGVIGGFVQSKDDYYSTLYTYKQIIDEGDTEGTLDDIVAAWPEDAWDLYDMLMARSPNNSETVLIAAADREIMPHAMLLEVLLVNPDALRNGNVIDHVENNLNNPMPGYMIDILHAASNQRTLRTTMESTLAYHHAEMSRNYNFIIQHYTSDTLNGVHGDSLLYYLGQMDSPTGKYNLAGRLMRIGQITEAMNIIDSIPLNYKLKPYQIDEWESMQAFFELLEDADRNDRNIATLDSTELVQLEMIATDPDGGIGALRARKALCFFYQNCIPGPALPKNNPGGSKKPLPPLEDLLADLNEIQAFPNPASEYVTFSFKFFKEKAQREILIYNSTGSLVQNFRIDNLQEGQQLWDTRKMKPGTYIYEVIEGEQKIHSGKIVIQ